MAPRKTKKKAAAQNPIVQLVEAAALIAEQKNLNEDDVIDCIERAVVTSLKQKYRIGKKVDVTGVLTCNIDKENCEMDIVLRKKVVGEFFDHKKHILLSKAQFYAPDCQPGDTVMVPLEPENYVDNNPADLENPDDPAFLYAYEPLDPEDAFFEYAEKTVVEEANTPDLTILLEEAWDYNPSAALGDYIEIHLTPEEYGFYQIAHKCKNIMVQNLRELESRTGMASLDNQAGEIKTAVVRSIDDKGNVTVTVDDVTANLPTGQQIPGDIYHPGDRIKVYNGRPYKDREGELRPMISRAHKDFVRALFKNEVPEVSDGTVEIMAIAREAGSRTKMAVRSDSIDPVGACIGPSSARINAVLSVLGGKEKIDIIKYSENKDEYVSAALSPATVLQIIPDSEDPSKCIAVVSHDRVSLAIGKNGQNARLAAQLTGMRIEVWDAAEHPGLFTAAAAVPAEETAVEEKEETDGTVLPEVPAEETDTEEVVLADERVIEIVVEDEEE